MIHHTKARSSSTYLLWLHSEDSKTSKFMTPWQHRNRICLLSALTTISVCQRRMKLIVTKMDSFLMITKQCFTLLFRSPYIGTCMHQVTKDVFNPFECKYSSALKYVCPSTPVHLVKPSIFLTVSHK